MTTVPTRCLIVRTTFTSASESSSSTCTFGSLYYSHQYNTTAGPQTLIKVYAQRFDRDEKLCVAENYRHPDNYTLRCWHTRISEPSIFNLYELEQALISSLRNSAHWLIGIGSVLLLPGLMRWSFVLDSAAAFARRPVTQPRLSLKQHINSRSLSLLSHSLSLSLLWSTQLAPHVMHNGSCSPSVVYIHSIQ